MSDTEVPEEIAIVGMAGRFPGASTLAQFWRNLRDGVESVVRFSDAELLAEGVDPDLMDHPKYVKAGAVLEDIDLFDAGFFGFSPSEAEIMSPQHRLFLECAWEAIESAGYDSNTVKGEVGVYAGVNMSEYLLNLYFNSSVSRLVNAFRVILGNDKDSLPAWVSYKLNLKGPSVNVQTACSTSLVAVHLACQGLLNYQCDMALAGGVNINVPQKYGYFYEEGGISSADGHTRSFDAQAQGSISANGLGVVVLKRLEEARAEGDTIYAVIKGSAINNDGATRIGFTAPSVQGQSRVIALALAMAGIRTETVSYIETHGSATALGDQIEIAALTQVFGSNTKHNGRVAIGSVKTNIGHAGAAAGIAGIIKTVLALQHRQIPPSLNFNQANPRIDFDNSPFYVNTGLAEWEANGTPRRAGVSSFGIGGTNAHAVLEEAPPTGPASASRPLQLLLLSARSYAALETATDNLAAHLKDNVEQNLTDVAFTLQTGRRNFEFRRMLVCSSREDAVSALETRNRKRVFSSEHEDGHRSVAFMFPGLGNHYVNMARGLYRAEEKFREQVDLCCELLKPHLGLDLREVVYPVATEDETNIAAGREVNLKKMLLRESQPPDEATLRFIQTNLSQPALFVVEYALAQLLMSWGVRPQAMIGYSLGEYVAACMAGVMSLADALKVVARRAQMIQELEYGAMLAVSLPEKEVLPLLNERVSVAGINGVALTVIAGPIEDVVALERQFSKDQIACRRLPTSHAFHSKMMAPIAAPVTELMKDVKLSPPQIPYLSNVTGTWITNAEATDPEYWTRHLCQPVRFADGIKQLWQEPGRVLVEVGPGQMLSSLAIQCVPNFDRNAPPAALPSIRSAYDQQSDEAFLLQTLGELWLKGVHVNWSDFRAGEQRRRLPLPTYPFQRQRYWVERRPIARQASVTKEPDCLHIPSWKRSLLPSGSVAEPKTYLIFFHDDELTPRLVHQLESKGATTVIVRAGERFARLDEHLYTINPRRQDDYRALLQVTGAVHLDVITSNTQEITGAESLNPEKAADIGVCLTLPQIDPRVTCRIIDVIPSEANSVYLLVDELSRPASTEVIAYRGKYRCSQLVMSSRDLSTGQATSKVGPTRDELSLPTATLHPRPELRNTYVEPGSQIEQTLAEIWERLLGVEKIGIHDNFFELGGNSLLGIQVIAQLRKLFQVDVPMPALFNAPTMAELALVVEDMLLTEIEGMSDEALQRTLVQPQA